MTDEDNLTSSQELSNKSDNKISKFSNSRTSLMQSLTKFTGKDKKDKSTSMKVKRTSVMNQHYTVAFDQRDDAESYLVNSKNLNETTNLRFSEEYPDHEFRSRSTENAVQRPVTQPLVFNQANMIDSHDDIPHFIQHDQSDMFKENDDIQENKEQLINMPDALAEQDLEYTMKLLENEPVQNQNAQLSPCSTVSKHYSARDQLCQFGGKSRKSKKHRDSLSNTMCIEITRKSYQGRGSTLDQLLQIAKNDDLEEFKELGIDLKFAHQFRFGEVPMNLLQLVVIEEAVQIVKYLSNELTKKENLQCKKTMLWHQYGENKELAIHLAMKIGSKSIIDCLINKLEADIFCKTAQGLTCMHTAAFSYTGCLSILLLHEHEKLCINSPDVHQARPLHFAVLSKEAKNVETLIHLGANVNEQDQEGIAPLHLALQVLATDTENFQFYKRIIKELLFNGAERSLQTNEGCTAMCIFEEIQVQLTDQQAKSLKCILKPRSTCLCFMLHRPIQKVKKTPFLLTAGLVFNAALFVLFISSIYYEGCMDSLLDPLNSLHDAETALAVVFAGISLVFHLISACSNPGYQEKKFEYVWLIDKALDYGLHLDNFCVYCEVIKSETSFHCTFCNKCVELFDHHCPYINNCLGHRNHGYFLWFLLFYNLYLLMVTIVTLKHFSAKFAQLGFSCIPTDAITFSLLVVVFSFLFISLFQLYHQTKGLCRREPPQVNQDNARNLDNSVMQISERSASQNDHQDDHPLRAVSPNINNSRHDDRRSRCRCKFIENLIVVYTHKFQDQVQLFKLLFAQDAEDLLEEDQLNQQVSRKQSALTNSDHLNLPENNASTMYTNGSGSGKRDPDKVHGDITNSSICLLKARSKQNCSFSSKDSSINIDSDDNDNDPLDS